MPRNSSGVYTVPAGTTAVDDTTIASAAYNNFTSDIASEMTGSLPRNGSAGMTAALNMGGSQVNNVANGVSTADAVNLGQLNQTVTGAGFPSGTRLTFQQSVPPVGWTVDTNFNDFAMRVVSGSVSQGGTLPFSTLFAASVSTNNHTLSQAELPNVTLSSSGLSISISNNTSVLRLGASIAGGTGGNIYQTSTLTGSVSGTIPLGGSGNGHSHTFEADVNFVDFIIAQKS